MHKNSSIQGVFAWFFSTYLILKFLFFIVKQEKGNAGKLGNICDDFSYEVKGS